MAKPRSLQGHARVSRRLAKLVPFYEYEEEEFFAADGAPAEIATRRRCGFARLAQYLQERAPDTLAMSEALEDGLPDLRFTRTYRVPFQFSRYVKKHLALGSVAQETEGVMITDLDGNASYDLTGSYGTNVFGYHFYKECIDAGAARVRNLGPVLGVYHPVIDENVRRLQAISGLDDVSFHMSGTEAVMQAVQLARYHTRRSHLVRLCGAYHGWWDGVQPGVGNPRRVHDVYTLRDLDQATLRVLRTRRDIACVLVNPLQALHPNAGAPADASLINSERSARLDRAAYADWLRQLRAVCTERSIVLIFDEVFVGFRSLWRRAGVSASGRYGHLRQDARRPLWACSAGRPVDVRSVTAPTDICFARTFNCTHAWAR